LLVKDVMMQPDYVGIRLELTNVGDVSTPGIRVIPLLDGQSAWDILRGPVKFNDSPAADGAYPGAAPGTTVEIVFPVAIPEGATLQDGRTRVDFRGRSFGAHVGIGRLRKITVTRP
jgi:hypothetical protein